MHITVFSITITVLGGMEKVVQRVAIGLTRNLVEMREMDLPAFIVKNTSRRR
jgi:hypothetical protein